MIFSSKIFKLASGTNDSYFVVGQDEIEMFVFSDLVSKKVISFLGKNFVRCKNTKLKFSYNKLIKLNQEFSAVCFDKNVSVIKNEA